MFFKPKVLNSSANDFVVPRSGLNKYAATNVSSVDHLSHTKEGMIIKAAICDKIIYMCEECDHDDYN